MSLALEHSGDPNKSGFSNGRFQLELAAFEFWTIPKPNLETKWLSLPFQNQTKWFSF
jgi:hypothetical protein